LSFALEDGSLTFPQAIAWAVSHNVDIITMSFGLKQEHKEMQEAILKAYAKNILIFAAASNGGGNREVKYPARTEQAICVYATDGKGNSFSGNPNRMPNSSYHFATLGVEVKSVWPKHLQKGAAPERRVTGTSFATPIAAGIAACVLEFALLNDLPEHLYSLLRRRQGMQVLFTEHLADRMTRDDFHYIHPMKLFSDDSSPTEILASIQRCLKR
jgi:hypothetical protein